MERSDKQRKPVAVKNLAELKRFIQPGVEFKTLSQKITLICGADPCRDHGADSMLLF